MHTFTVVGIDMEPTEQVLDELEAWHGVDRSTGNALFITRTADRSHLGLNLPGQIWSACLWRGWEDGSSAPRDFGRPRYATRDLAVAALARTFA